MGVFGFKFTGLVFVPDKTGKLGDRGLRVETVDIANLSDNAGGVDLADAWDGCQSIGNNFELLFNGFVQTLTCSFSARMEAIETDIAWFTVSFTVLGRR